MKTTRGLSAKAVQGTKQSKARAVQVADLSRVATTVTADRLQCLENVGPIQTAKGRAPCRWTGDRPSFSLFVTVERETPVIVTLECLESASESNWANVFMECEESMHLCTYSPAGRKHLISGVLPALPGTTSAVLRFHIQETREIKSSSGHPLPEGRVGLCLARLTVARAADKAPAKSRRHRTPKSNDQSHLRRNR